MAFDPTQTDAERVVDHLRGEYPNASVLLDDFQGRTTLIVSPSPGNDAESEAQTIASELDEKGLTTRVEAMSDDGQHYDVLATTDYWN